MAAVVLFFRAGENLVCCMRQTEGEKLTDFPFIQCHRSGVRNSDRQGSVIPQFIQIYWEKNFKETPFDKVLHRTKKAGGGRLKMACFSQYRYYHILYL